MRPSGRRLGRDLGRIGRLGGVVAVIEKHLKTIGFSSVFGTQAQRKTSKSRPEDVLWASRNKILASVRGNGAWEGMERNE